MAETADRPPVAKPVSRLRSRKPAAVSASALAQYLDCSRTYVGKLENWRRDQASPRGAKAVVHSLSPYDQFPRSGSRPIKPSNFP